MARLAAGAQLAAILILSCSPKLKEEWYSCSEDSDCPPGWHCHPDDLCHSDQPAEDTEETCHNGIDDDGLNGGDCLDPGCVEAGFCLDFIPDPPCDPVEQTGCPIGLGCYVGFEADGNDHYYCGFIESTNWFGEGCEDGCAAGNLCISYDVASSGICEQWCYSDYDCPQGSLCSMFDSETLYIGSCRVPCNPNRSGQCPEGFACVNYHAARVGMGYRDGSFYHHCLNEVPEMMDGTADVGEPCEDVAGSATESSSICMHGTACITQDDVEFTCRYVCEMDMLGDCPPTTTCTQPEGYLYDFNPPSDFFGYPLGYCI
jgi:hypothetical protein